MLPARKRAAVVAARHWHAVRHQHTEQHQSACLGPSEASVAASSEPLLTGSASAELLADAIAEESVASSSSSRDGLRQTQSPIRTGDESQSDVVLRMLVDAHKPLRSGQGVKHNSADEKIRGWMRGLKLEPRTGIEIREDVNQKAQQETVRAHRTTIPPHLHRPWHSTYTGQKEAAEEAPKVKYGMFIRKRSDGEELSNLMELRLPPNAEAKARARLRELKKAGKVVQRFEKAREGALDYRLGLVTGDDKETVEATDDDTFQGNRQVKGSSVLGAQRGGASGLKAWAGLAEDRIQRARDAGFLKPTTGIGKPIPPDPEARNPHIEIGELLMNRIVKRQGALPPWIELQVSLDSAQEAFRTTLLKTYTTHVVRAVISTNSLSPLPSRHSIPTRDEAWEARELKFHQENIKQINELVRRMNAQAPAVARRPLVMLEAELTRVRGDVLRDAVWAEVKRRAEEVFVRQKQASTTNSTSTLFESDSLTRLKNATKRSLSTIAAPVAAVLIRSGGGGFVGGKDRIESGAGGAESSKAGSSKQPRYGLLIAIGLGVAGVWSIRKPLRADYTPAYTVPVSPPHRIPSTPLVAISPAEQSSSPIRILKVYVLEPFLTLIRFLHLALLFGPVILSTPMLFVGSTQQRRRPGKPAVIEEENWGAIWWYGLLVKQMERAGPSFTKLGQWAASRADLFPAALCQKMSKLHSNGKPHSLQHTKRLIEKAFGLKFDDIFEEFGQLPIGCGAIAQVYRAKLKSGLLGVPSPSTSRSSSYGETDIVPQTSVAIKVLHPRVQQTIKRDIAIMSLFAKVINAFPGMEWISLPEEVAVFGEMMNMQLDLRVEAANLERFEHNFHSRGRRVTFPRPIKLGLAADGYEKEEMREVLVEEYEDALPLKYFLQNGGGPFDDKIANIGLDAFLEMLLLDNWTHGDLHPGNIMVRFFKPNTTDLMAPLLSRFSRSAAEPENTIPTQSVNANEIVHSLSAVAHDTDAWVARLDELETEGYEPQLIFIDAGLVTSLNNTNRRNFLDLFSAVAEFDGYKAGKLMVDRCRTPHLAVDEETFALKMQHIVLSVKSKTFSLANIKISDILTDVLMAVRQHHVKMEGDFVNTVISILLLEGIGRQLDPNIDLFKSALPILRQLGRQMGTREAISAVPKGNIWAMAKIWVWIEARQVAGEVSAFDEWIKAGVSKSRCES